jgi:uncharacterized protein YcbK (DUF882 family)
VTAGARAARTRAAAAPFSRWVSLAVFGAAAVTILAFSHPPRQLLAERSLAARRLVGVPAAAPSRDAFGVSGEVHVRFSLPGATVQYPLELGGDPSELRYAWVKADGSSVDAATIDSAKPVAGAEFTAPASPGFYRLALLRDEQRRVVDGLTLAVLVPFGAKRGGSLNGYRIGTYRGERLPLDQIDRPAGFVEVTQTALDFSLTKHLRLSDFVTHDGQETWPRYVAINPRLLDKLELVMSEIGSWYGGIDRLQIALDVHSGFRTPLHNRSIANASTDSRHQYGDAADISLDANNDGKINETDVRMIALAVEVVERDHPDLIGGMGFYRHGGSSYVHVDVRGMRVRWTG